jgi:predicted AAA+ superfamily ATPase
MQTYLQRDVRDLAQVGNEMAFAKFVRACAARTGQLLNLSDLAKDVDISVPTAKHWLSVLQASFQVHLLPPYHSNLTKRLIGLRISVITNWVQFSPHHCFLLPAFA